MKKIPHYCTRKLQEEKQTVWRLHFTVGMLSLNGVLAVITIAGFGTEVTEILLLKTFFFFKMSIGLMAKNNSSAQYSATRTAPLFCFAKDIGTRMYLALKYRREKNNYSN